MPGPVLLFRKTQTPAQTLFLNLCRVEVYQLTNLIGQHGELDTVVLADMLQHGQHVEGLLVTSHECGERAAFNLNHLFHNLLFLECSSFFQQRSTSERW